MTELIKEMDAGDYIAVIACFISVISAVVAVVSCIISKQQLKLQRKQYDDGNPNFNMKVLDAIIKKDNNSSVVQIWLNIRVSNLSDKATSINNIVLRLFCLEDTIYRPYLNENLGTNTEITYLSTAQNIGAHSSEIGWCVYSLPIDIYNNLQIEYSELNIEDIHGKKNTEKIIYMREEWIDYGM